MLISVKSFLRTLLPLLLGLLASCSVYDNLFHPYRLPTPPMSKEAKAKARAAEKARHKGTSLKPADPDADDGTTPPASGGAAAPAGKDPKADNKLTYNELPAGTKLKYDKQLLLKKPKLKRRQYHHYDTHPLKPNRVNRENRRLRRHSKGKDKDHDRPSTRPDAPAPDEGMAPPPEPTPAPEPKKRQEKDAPKPPKAKKAPIPKPDPTQQNPDH